MKVFGLAGWSGAGKTTLMVGLVSGMVARGLRVSTVKHTHHDFDLDRPGKDSFRHREAGATEVLVKAGRRWALMHELRDEDPPSLEQMTARLAPVDILLVEGFKTEPYPKLEIHRPSLEKPMLWPNDPHIVAVASDVVLPGLTLPGLDLNDHVAITDFILTHMDLLP